MRAQAAKSTALDAEFLRIVEARALEAVFQPIVHLRSGQAIGYEALIRGPAGSPLASASSLLEAAYRTGRVVEFDWAARAVACRAALDSWPGREGLIFLNVEPLALGSECPPDLKPDIDRAFDAFRIILEVTERTLDRDPGPLLEGIDRQRPTVSGLALDDVGSHTITLSMLPVLSPDLIKLDMAITQGRPSAATM